MRLLLLACSLWVASAALAGCSVWTGKGAASDSPEQALARLRSALLARDWAAVYAQAGSPSTQRSLEAAFQASKRDLVKTGGDAMFAASIGLSRDEYLRMSSRDFFVKMSGASGKATGVVPLPDPESMRSARVVDAQREDDEAVLTVDLGGQPRKMFFVLEDGRWYFKALDFD